MWGSRASSPRRTSSPIARPTCSARSRATSARSRPRSPAQPRTSAQQKQAPFSSRTDAADSRTRGGGLPVPEAAACGASRPLAGLNPAELSSLSLEVPARSCWTLLGWPVCMQRRAALTQLVCAGGAGSAHHGAEAGGGALVLAHARVTMPLRRHCSMRSSMRRWPRCRGPIASMWS